MQHDTVNNEENCETILIALIALLITLTIPIPSPQNINAISIIQSPTNFQKTSLGKIINISPAQSSHTHQIVAKQALLSEPDDDINITQSTVAHLYNVSHYTLKAAMHASTPSCNQTLWNHVYHQWRLNIVDPCITASGVIDAARNESDGDVHILVNLDPQFVNLTNQANQDHQAGDLVVEPICHKPPTQTSAIPACANFHQNLRIPAIGTHVNITGSYVLDNDHFGWAEIHPVKT